MNQEFVKKLIRAKKLEYEAFQELIPEKVKKQAQVMQKDLKGILQIGISEISMNNKSEVQQEKKRTKKVDIQSEEE